MRLRIQVSTSHATQAVVSLTGELALDTVPEFTATLEGVAQGEVRNVVLDLSAISYLSSVGASAIVRARDELGSHGRELVITGARGTVQTVLDLLGLSWRA
jgi:anti-sigma B factor antagonist